MWTRLERKSCCNYRFQELDSLHRSRVTEVWVNQGSSSSWSPAKVKSWGRWVLVREETKTQEMAATELHRSCVDLISALTCTVSCSVPYLSPGPIHLCQHMNDFDKGVDHRKAEQKKWTTPGGPTWAWQQTVSVLFFLMWYFNFFFLK